MSVDRATNATLARIAAAKSAAELSDLYGEAIARDVTFEAWAARRTALEGSVDGAPDLASEARRHAIALASIAAGRRVSAREAAAWTFGRDARIAPERSSRRPA